MRMPNGRRGSRGPKRRGKNTGSPSGLSRHLAERKKAAEEREQKINTLAIRLQKLSGTSGIVRILAELHKFRVDIVRYETMIKGNVHDAEMTNELREDIADTQRSIREHDLRLTQQKQSLELLGPLGEEQLKLIQAIENLIKEIH